MIAFWEEYAEEQGGKLMSRLLAQVELVDFYFSKVESYMGKKQEEGQDLGSPRQNDRFDIPEASMEESVDEEQPKNSKMTIETGPTTERSSTSAKTPRSK